LPTVALLVLAAAAAIQARPAATPTPTPSSAPLAILDGQPITAAEIEPIGGAQLTNARTQWYNAQRSAVEEAITRRLLEKEAKARNVTVAELVRAEIESKVAPVTPAEQKAFYDANKARYFANTPEPEALKQIELGLGQQRMQQRRAEYANSLRLKSNVRILLDVPRTVVTADDDPAKGPADAPITIVEFSDFQCPYCSRVNPTLARLKDRYGDSIRIVFRDYPILQLHPQAAKAAEAGACANDQGKFWQMHDLMFANQQRLDLATLKQHAATLGLDAKAFETCLDSGKYTEEWKKDSADAEKAGVQSTPAFFVNGRPVIGAQPYEAFAEVINEELGRLNRPIPAEKPVAAASPAAPPTQ
jgi:protein-disulfide isomerase